MIMSCPDCFSGALHEGTIRGCDVVLHDELPCYYTAPNPSLPVLGTLLYLSDVFGHKFINARLLADQYAAAGFHVFIPDILGGDAIPAEQLSVLDLPPSTSTLAWLSNGFRLAGAIPRLIPWLASHTKKLTAPRVDLALKAVKLRMAEIGAPANLFAVGFCFGGPWAVRLAAAKSVDAFVALHPSAMEVPGDIQPIALAEGPKGMFCIVATDPAFPAANVAAAKKMLANAKAPVTFIEYTGHGVAHGFAVRGGEHTFDARKKCLNDVTTFFTSAVQATMTQGA
jgi:dienelactone hydrolase